MDKSKASFEDMHWSEINGISNQCGKSLQAKANIVLQFLESNLPIVLNKLPQMGDYILCQNAHMKNCMVQIEVNNLEQHINDISPNMATRFKRFVNVWKASSVFNICVPQDCNSTETGLLLGEIEGFYYNNTKNYLLMDITCEDFQLVSTWTANLVKFGFIFITLMILSCNLGLIPFKTNKFLQCFSMRKHFNYLFHQKTSRSKLSFINGIRAVSSLWVIYGHVHEVNIYYPTVNVAETFHWINSYKSVFVILAPLAVDQFLALNGFLIGFTQKPFIPALVKRIIGIILPMYPLLLLFHTILSDSVNGLMGITTKKHLKQTCTEYVWSSYLLIQNYYNPYAMCAGHVWYLAMDIQLFMLSPIVLYILKEIKHGIGILVGISFAFCLWATIVAYSMKLDLTPQSWLVDYFTHIYFPAHLRSPVWICGIIVGHFSSQKQIQAKDFMQNRIFWIIFLTTIMTIATILIHGPNWHMNLYISSIFTGFHRLLWSMSCLWIIISCLNDQSATLNKFLSMKVFTVISKLSYCIYLTHAAVQQIIIGNRTQPFQFTTLSNLEDFVIQVIFTLIASIYWYLFIQCPIISLFKFLFNYIFKNKIKTS